ncbi:MAG: hypothetical protein Kow0031_34750 [Anaerolineae bacterium]
MRHFLQPVGANTLYLLAVNVVNALAGFGLAALLAHSLGDAGFGQFTFAFTWILTLLTFVEFGISTVLVRDLALSPADTPRYLPNSVAVKWLLSAPIAIALIFFAGGITPFDSRQAAAALQWGGLFLLAGLAYSSYTAVFKAQQRMGLILLTTLPGQLAAVGGVAALLTAKTSLAAIVIWLGISQWLQLLIAHRLLVRQPGPRPEFAAISKSFMWRLLKLAWPFALAGLLAALQLRASTLLLAYLAGDQPLGWYSAAGRIGEAARQLPGAFFVALLPALTAISRRQQLARSLKLSQAGLLAFSLAAALAIVLLAAPLINFIYGPGFQPAIPMLQVLALGLIPALQNSLLVVFLYSRGDERFVNRLIAAGIAINLSLCLGFIPQWGGLGAALALLAADSLLYLPYRWRAARYA